MDWQQIFSTVYPKCFIDRKSHNVIKDALCVSIFPLGYLLFIF